MLRLGTLWMCLITTCVWLAACAEAEGPDAGSPGDAGDADEAVEEVGEDTRRDTQPEDTEPEVAEDTAEDIELAGECEPFTSTCSDDGYAVQRCSASGELFAPSPCTDEEVCEADGDTAECVTCTPDVDCRPPDAVCEPGTDFCLDFETAASCDDDGQVDNTAGCGAGRCFGGGCTSAGSETGGACTTNDGDMGCKGRYCVCGAEDTANGDTVLCDGNLAAGYCSTASCDQNGCDPTSEWCADFALSGAFGGQHLCLLTANCANDLGSCDAAHRGDNHVCRMLPSTNRTATERTWGLACWVPPPADVDLPCAAADCLSPIGWACNSNADCVGGLCLTMSNDVSYCAASCNDDLLCPESAACVRPTGTGETGLCLALADSDVCPRLTTTPFEIVQRNFSNLDGTETIAVCYEPTPAD